MTERKEAVRTMARRLQREFRPTTEHGDKIELAEYEAETLADIIAEYVEAHRPLGDGE